MLEKRGGLLSPVIVDMAGKKGRVTVQGSTLLYTDMTEGGETPGPGCKLDRDIKAFEVLVTEPGRLYAVVVDEGETISGVSLGKGSFNKLFEPYKAAGAVNSLSLALGLKNDINVFFASSGSKGARLFHFRVENATLQQVSVLEEGTREDFRVLKSSSDLWGSFNLFYLALEKGVTVLKHSFFVPFSKTWSTPVTLYGPDQGEVLDYSFLIDTDNNIYVALLLEGVRKKEIIHLKRDMGGWPRGGWQRPILISQEDRKGMPVIDFFRKGYVQIFFFSEEESKLFVWRDGEVKSLQRKTLDAGGKDLARFRSSSGARALYTLWDEDKESEPELPVGSPGNEGEDAISIPEEDGEGPGGDEAGEAGGEERCEAGGAPDGDDLEREQRDERDRFVRQAVQVMQAKVDLEAGLRKKEKELTRQKNLYESKLRLLRDQLSSRGEAFKSLEAKLSRQEAAVLGYRAEQKSWEKEINQLKKENWELKEAVKGREKDNRELAIQVDQLKRNLEELERQAANRGIMNRLGQIFKK